MKIFFVINISNAVSTMFGVGEKIIVTLYHKSNKIIHFRFARVVFVATSNVYIKLFTKF